MRRMKSMLAVLFFLATSAQAQTQFDCAPAPLGSGTSITYRMPDGGALAWWWCRQTDGSWRAQMIVATTAWLSSNTGAIDWSALLAAPDKLVAINALMAKNESATSGALAPLWQPFTTEIMASAPAASAPPPAPPASAPPPQPAYVVATNGTTATRPTYPGDPIALTVNTSKALSYRAPVGAACVGPAFRNGTSSTTYMAVAGGPDMRTVAVCTPKP